jgi:hypothetical protein
MAGFQTVLTDWLDYFRSNAAASPPRHNGRVGGAHVGVALQTGRRHHPRRQGTLPAANEATDRQIDALVYELYGLTEEEVAVVEGH